jgi:hypothetical protein
MRLLNTHTLEFEEFVGRSSDSYAILSHRSGYDEVSYKEFRKSREAVKHRAGYKKIAEFCEISKQRGYRLAWIDTCCIDKRSSAELSEVLNSMYEWYENSSECYVWLEDYSGNLDDLHKCTWFSRAWTLQEMLAPERVVFFTSDWKVIGHKIFTITTVFGRCKVEAISQAGLSIGQNLIPWLAKASGIPQTYLLGTSVHQASVAARMSWASRRKATRVEDRAYSLMGLFGIHMPMLYGEGDASFRRLQEEIMRNNDDSSIFCINNRPDFLMVRSPECFANRGSVTKGRIPTAEPYSFTNRGLKLFATASTSYIKPPVRDTWWARTVFRIDLGCEAGCEVLDYLTTIGSREAMGHDQSMPSGTQHLYLVQDGDTYRRLAVAPNHLSQAVLTAEWVNVREKLFFVVEGRETELRYPDGNPHMRILDRDRSCGLPLRATRLQG